MHPSHVVAEAARLQPLAEQVLTRYDVIFKEISHLATHSNVLYRIVSSNGRQLVMRVASPEANTRTNMQYEVDWLVALNRDTNLDVVAPIPTASGRLVTEITDPLSGLLRPCVLFTWVPGSPVGINAGTFAYRLLGRMSASLQLHGKTWLPKDPKELRHWNKVFYYGDDLDPVVIFDARYEHFFSHSRRATIDRAIPVVEKVLDETWRSQDVQIVHGDLHEWNVHMVGTRLYAFDFEDVMMATPAQDVAVSLYASRTSSRVKDITRAFREGYEEYRPWPIKSQEQLDGIHAARQITLMNFAARTLPMDEAADYVDRVMPWLEAYLARYG
ncbi:MAG: phosphotransferase [Acidimicrobiia bacterium]|nr:phosphotransferase [Acidimicrobiia bacterium]